MYRYSQFNFWFEYSKNSSFLIGYNSLRETVVALTKREKKMLDQKLDSNDFSDDNLSVLLDLGILVNCEENEYDTLINTLESGKFTNDTLYVMYSYTTHCNLKCPYCFQQNLERKNINTNVKDDLYSWMQSMLNKHNFSILAFSLFGGEPLLNLNEFNYYVDKTKEFCDENEVDYALSFTSNGVLLNRLPVKKLIDKGLKGFQVTLDGSREYHDKTRISKKIPKTYDIILNNLKNIYKISDELKITIEINFDKYNYKSISNLLDDLIKNGITKPTLSPEPIMAAYNKDNDIIVADNVLEGEELLSAYKFVVEEIIKRGLNISPTLGRIHPCTFTHAHQFMIDPEGDIYKCAFMMGFDVFKTGNVGNEYKINQKWENVKKLKDHPLCNSCEFVPICAGGCKYEAWLKYNDFDDVVCRKNMLNTIQPLLIEYRKRDKISSLIDGFVN